MTNVRDFGAVGDGVADDTQAFVAAIASVRARRAYLPLTGGGTVSMAAGGVIEVPPGVYRLTDDVLLQQREHLRGEAGSYLSFSAGGLVFESFFNQSQAEAAVSKLGIYSTHGGVGLWAQGSGYSRADDCSFGGWDECIRLTNTNGFEASSPIFSSFNQMGNPHPIGVHLCGTVGGACNGNRVLGGQWNACAIGVWSEDGQGNEVSGNFNSCGEVARIEGTQGLRISGEAEGCTSNAYFRFGPPGGYQLARIVAQTLDLSGFSISRNETQMPAMLCFEYLAQAWTVRLDGGKSFGSPPGPLVACGSPWPTIPYVMIRDLYRSGFLINGSKPTGQQLFDRPLYGLDHGA